MPFLCFENVDTLQEVGVEELRMAVGKGYGGEQGMLSVSGLEERMERKLGNNSMREMGAGGTIGSSPTWMKKWNGSTRGQEEGRRNAETLLWIAGIM